MKIKVYFCVFVASVSDVLTVRFLRDNQNFDLNIFASV